MAIRSALHCAGAAALGQLLHYAHLPQTSDGNLVFAVSKRST
jgi:hypothetical protein